jgi:hypothetical protein
VGLDRSRDVPACRSRLAVDRAAPSRPPIGHSWLGCRIAGTALRQLRQPRSGRVRGDAQVVYPAGAVFNDEERIEPVQTDRVEVKQVAGQDPLCLLLEELRPGWSGSPRRGIDARRVAYFPYCGGTDLVAESGEFAVYASIPPGGILGGQAHDGEKDASGEGGSTWPRVRGAPAAADESPVPAHDRGWGDQKSATASG